LKEKYLTSDVCPYCKLLLEMQLLAISTRFSVHYVLSDWLGFAMEGACNGLTQKWGASTCETADSHTHKLPLWREVSECVFVGVCVTVCV
jgi:hypothetical protein